jgi:hypothetical protein
VYFNWHSVKCEITFATSFLHCLEKGNIPEDVNIIFESLEVRYINDTQNNCESDRIVIPTMCYICVVNQWDRRRAQLKSIVLQFARSTFPWGDNGVDTFEQMQHNGGDYWNSVSASAEGFGRKSFNNLRNLVRDDNALLKRIDR